MPDIFISYARTDETERGRIAPIVAGLSGAGYDVYHDVEIPAGESWADVLREKIERARCVLVLWSETSVESRWVREEASFANDAGKLVPAFIDDVKPPFGFTLIQGAPLWDWSGDPNHAGWCNLLEVLARRLGPSAPPPAARVARRRTGRSHWRRMLSALAAVAGAASAVFWSYASDERAQPEPELKGPVHSEDSTSQALQGSPLPPEPPVPVAATDPVQPCPGGSVLNCGVKVEVRRAVSPSVTKPKDGYSSEVTRLLSDAEEALKAGESERAIAQARIALRRATPPLAAQIVLVKAYCQQRDLGMAIASARNLSVRDRKLVQSYCAGRGIQLGQ